jgi:hypothetical protein
VGGVIWTAWRDGRQGGSIQNRWNLPRIGAGRTKEWAQDITLIDDPVGLAVLWHSCRCSVMLSSHRGDAGGRRPTRGWCERRVLVQGIVALGESSSHSGPQREGEPRGVACAGFRDRLRERGFGRGERWRLCCSALLFNVLFCDSCSQKWGSPEWRHNKSGVQADKVCGVSQRDTRWASKRSEFVMSASVPGWW